MPIDIVLGILALLERLLIGIGEFITSNFITLIITIGVVGGYIYSRNFDGVVFGGLVGAIIGLILSN